MVACSIGFRKGYIVIVSTNVNEIGQEQFSGRFYEKRLLSASYSRVNNCLAMAGEKGLKIINMHKYKVGVRTRHYPDFYCVAQYLVAHQPE